MKTATAVVCLALALGCGGGGSPTTPAAPATPAPTPRPVLSFADGITDAPLTPQSVTPANPAVGGMVTVALDGYMLREQVWTGLRIELWPLPTGRNQERAYTDLVYGGDSPRALLKWDGLSYTAAIDPMAPEWASRAPEIKGRLSGVFADVASAGGPVFSWVPEGLSYAALTIKVDPANECLQPDYAACTRTWWNGNALTRAEVIFSEPDYALEDSLSMHMVGYAIGLSNWNQVNAVMNPSWRQRSATFHELERNAIHMMYQHRIAGNVLPDRAPGFTSSAKAPGSEVHREPGPFGMRGGGTR